VGFTNGIHEIKTTWSSTSSGTGGYHNPNAGKFFFFDFMQFVVRSVVSSYIQNLNAVALVPIMN
jgi:hypothetical protein